MKRSIINAFAAISLAIALSGCIIVPWHHHDGGYYGGGPGQSPGYYHNGN